MILGIYKLIAVGWVMEYMWLRWRGKEFQVLRSWWWYIKCKNVKYLKGLDFYYLENKMACLTALQNV